MMSLPDPAPSPIGRHRLNGLLSRWAVARRLDAPHAEQIRRRILGVPNDLGFDWWWRLLDPVNGSAFRGAAAHPMFASAFSRSIAASPFVGGTPGSTAWPLPEPTDWKLPDPTVWSSDDTEYQPYLRLT